jgi:Flp pilus assembly protein TadG
MMLRRPRSNPLARKFLKDRYGGVLIYVAIALPVFLGVSGLAVDVSVWHAHKRHIQTIADAGAVAGASELVRMIEASNRNGLADTAAREDATASGAKVSDQIAVNIPPTGGDYAGATNAVEVIVTRDAPSLLSRFVFPQQASVSARAVAFASEGEYCIYSLNSSKANALHISGGAAMSLDCGVMVNSSASAPDEALHVTGGGCLNASVIKVVGEFSGNGCYNTSEPFQGTEAIENPLAGKFPTPAAASGICTTSGNLTVHSGDDVDLPAGRHCGKITVQNGGTLRLAGGTHVLDKALTVHGTLIEKDDPPPGVTLYMGPDTGNSDALNFAADADVTLSAPTTPGPYASRDRRWRASNC